MSNWIDISLTMPLVFAQTETAMPDTHAETGVPPTSDEPSPWRFFSFSIFAFIVLAIVAVAATRRMRLVPKGLQNFIELVVETVYGIPEMVMGERGRQYAPFLATLFLYIIVMNLSGLIPGFKSGTANLNITAALAITAFIMVQYFGFRAHGPKYVMHFFGPVPLTNIPSIILGLLLLPLELLSELVRPVSLSFRLFGNIFGEEQIISVLATQFGNAGPFIAVVMLPLQVLTSVLQALVFTLLVAVYIALATEKHEEHHEDVAKATAH